MTERLTEVGESHHLGPTETFHYGVTFGRCLFLDKLHEKELIFQRRRDAKKLKIMKAHLFGVGVIVFFVLGNVIFEVQPAAKSRGSDSIKLDFSRPCFLYQLKNPAITISKNHILKIKDSSGFVIESSLPKLFGKSWCCYYDVFSEGVHTEVPAEVLMGAAQCDYGNRVYMNLSYGRESCELNLFWWPKSRKLTFDSCSFDPGHSPGAGPEESEEEITELEAHNPDIILREGHQKALKYFSSREIKKAVQEMEKAISNPDAARATKDCTRIFLSIDPIPGTSCVIDKERWIEFRNDLAFFLDQDGQPQKAKVILEEVLKLSPLRAVAHLNFADVLWKLNEHQAAGIEYKFYSKNISKSKWPKQLIERCPQCSSAH